ncbi:hypothetical protein Hanom_Chr05g00441031 [Helianthus anomalus]
MMSRDEIEIRFSKKVESNDDDVLEISKADYLETLLKKSTSLPAGTVRSPTPKKVHVQETLNKGDASHFKTMQNVKGKGKAKVFADISETLENLKKECKGRQCSQKSDSIPYRPFVC